MKTALAAFPLLLLLAGNAHGQSAAGQRAAPSPVMVAPRPLAPLHADYPEGAAGDATVLLVVVVNADGSVRTARAVEGSEPFVAAALTASPSWSFAPATRDGKATAASIRVEIRFVAPPLVPVAAPLAVAPIKIPSAGVVSKPPPPIEVTVRGEPAPPGATSMSRAEVRLLPGAFGDPFRAIEVLPGVTPIASGVPYFYVRGAPPGNVGYFLDGIRVPLLYHIGLGPSVIHPGIVDRVDLYPGGYPARFGRFSGGIVAGETRAPLPEAHAEGNVRIVDAGALVEAPFAGGRATALVAGRYSYLAPLLSLFNVPLELGYGDYQARITYDATPRDRLTVFAFGAYDFMRQKATSGTRTVHVGDSSIEVPSKVPARTLFDTTFHRLDLRHEHRIDKDTTLLQAVTLGYDQTQLDQGRYARDRMLGVRSELVHRAGASVVVRAGVDAMLDDDQVDLDRGSVDQRPFTSLFVSRQDLTVGAHADVVVQVTSRLSVTPGLRVDLFGSRGRTAVGVDPRLAWQLDVAPWLRLAPALGVASQPPSFILPGPGFSLGLGGGLQRSVQTSARVEVDLPADIQASVTPFQSAFFNLSDALGTNPASGTDLSGPFNQRSVGSSEGIEIAVRRRLTRQLGGFLSYTLARSERVLARPVLDLQGATPRIRVISTRFPSTFDRTHVLNVALSYDFGKGFRAGARVVFYTGYPRTRPGIPPNFQPVVLEDRFPPFFRLDVRLEKRWTVSRTGWVSLVLEGQNITLSTEVIGTDCSTGSCVEQRIGPVTIPSIGLEGGL